MHLLFVASQKSSSPPPPTFYSFRSQVTVLGGGPGQRNIKTKWKGSSAIESGNETHLWGWLCVRFMSCCSGTPNSLVPNGRDAFFFEIQCNCRLIFEYGSSDVGDPEWILDWFLEQMHIWCVISFSYELFMSLIGRIGLEPFSIIVIVLKISVKHRGCLGEEGGSFLSLSGHYLQNNLFVWDSVR